MAGEFSSTPCQSIRAEEMKCFLTRKCLRTCERVLFHDLAHPPDDHSSRLPQLLQQPHNALYLGKLPSAAQKQLQHGGFEMGQKEINQVWSLMQFFLGFG